MKGSDFGAILGLVVGFVFGSLVFGGPAAHADPKGMTVTRLDLNPEARTLEAALRVEPKPLEKALTAYFGKPVDLTGSGSDDPADRERLERQIFRYVRDTFSVTAPGDRPLEPRWVGWERESFRRLWIYVELAFPKGVEPTIHGLEVSQRIFFEIAPEQANTVRLRAHGRQTAVICTREQPRHTIRFESE